jgi:dipeptidase D
VTGTPGKPVAIGGGTQARLFPGGVDFGPAEDMVLYRGHGTDEYLTPEEVHRIAELTMAAVVRLASSGGGRPTS